MSSALDADRPRTNERLNANLARLGPPLRRDLVAAEVNVTFPIEAAAFDLLIPKAREDVDLTSGAQGSFARKRREPRADEPGAPDARWLTGSPPGERFQLVGCGKFEPGGNRQRRHRPALVPEFETGHAADPYLRRNRERGRTIATSRPMQLSPRCSRRRRCGKQSERSSRSSMVGPTGWSLVVRAVCI